MDTLGAIAPWSSSSTIHNCSGTHCVLRPAAAHTSRQPHASNFPRSSVRIPHGAHSNSRAAWLAYYYSMHVLWRQYAAIIVCMAPQDSVKTLKRA